MSLGSAAGCFERKQQLIRQVIMWQAAVAYNSFIVPDRRTLETPWRRGLLHVTDYYLNFFK